MPSGFLDYFAATPEERQLSSVVAVAYPHAGVSEPQFDVGVLRVNADEQPLGDRERRGRGQLLDALSLQLHHGVVARDERVVSSGADSCVLGIEDLEPRVLAENMTQRFLRIMGSGRVDRRADASVDRHRQKELYMPWVASEMLFSMCRSTTSKASSLLGSSVTTLYELLPNTGFVGFLRRLGLATGVQWHRHKLDKVALRSLEICDGGGGEEDGVSRSSHPMFKAAGWKVLPPWMEDFSNSATLLSLEAHFRSMQEQMLMAVPDADSGYLAHKTLPPP
ncbi:hypothetical protein T484DRAFT_1858812 [Baffinella frigidus]|nr:hypothetical protein T484DRAFT_1858812 [Cryptophyta sp. CCMP2293]